MKVWQKARELAKSIYIATSNFPKEEIFGLTSQIRRSAVSIASNIAEGSGRNTDGEFINFWGIANGSSFELETQLMIALDLGYISDSESVALQQDLIEIQKMLFTFISKLKSK
jgi:four helix bundle protein